MNKSISKIQDIIWGMTDQNAVASDLNEKASQASWARDDAWRNWQENRKHYGKALRSYIKRKTQKIVFNHSQSWGTDVEVFPLHSGTTKTTGPLVTVKWNGKHGRIELTCWAITPERVEQFLERFEAVVKAAELHQERINP